MKIGYLMQAGVPDIRQRPLSGPANHVWQVYKNLEALGHQLRLLAVLDGKIWISDDLKEFEPVSIPWLEHGPLRLFERVLRRVQFTLRLPYAAWFESARFAQACLQELPDCDVFYERMGWVGYGGIMAARRLKIPLVLEVNGDHLDEFESLGIGPRGGQRWLSTWLVRRAIRRTAHIVAAGDGWRDKFMHRWQTPPEKITTVENGTELVERLAQHELRAFQPVWTNDRSLTIVYLGGFYPWQGVGLLLEAFAQARQQMGRHARLLLIGSGPEAVELRNQADKLGLDEEVIFTGQVTMADIARYLAQADIGVSPYCGRDEFSGLKLLDYKAAGLAIIASGKEGQPAILENGRTALIVPPCGVTALSAALQRLAADADLRRCLGQNARAEAESQHSWRQTAVQIERILQQATEETAI
jgi:glycosyltransferase involved in cell wall biosynthesis